MQLIDGALGEFNRARTDGLLPAAVPFENIRTGAVGLSASGIHVDPRNHVDARTAALSQSDDPVMRAVAAIFACFNVGRATMRNPDLRCIPMSIVVRSRTRPSVPIIAHDTTGDLPSVPQALTLEDNA
jgi:hypothetical protein